MNPRRERTRIGSCVTSVPRTSMRPFVGRMRPSISRNIVVLPAPFAPTRPTDPEGTVTVSSSSAVTPPSNVLVRPSRTKAGEGSMPRPVLPVPGGQPDAMRPIPSNCDLQAAVGDAGARHLLGVRACERTARVRSHPHVQHRRSLHMHAPGSTLAVDEHTAQPRRLGVEAEVVVVVPDGEVAGDVGDVFHRPTAEGCTSP